MKTATIIARLQSVDATEFHFTRDSLRQMAEDDPRLSFDEVTGALTMDVELADRQEILQTWLAAGSIAWVNEGESDA